MSVFSYYVKDLSYKIEFLLGQSISQEIPLRVRNSLSLKVNWIKGLDISLFQSSQKMCYVKSQEADRAQSLRIGGNRKR